MRCRRKIFQKTLHIFMHGFCHHLAVGNGFHNGSGAVYHITGGENAWAGGVTW